MEYGEPAKLVIIVCQLLPAVTVCTAQKAIIYQVITTPKNVLFPGHNHLLTTGTSDLTLWLSPLLAIKR